MRWKPIAITLLRGSHNIDLMRKQIDELIRMLVGLIDFKVAKIRFDDAGGYWIMDSPEERREKQPMVCFTYWRRDSYNVHSPVYSSNSLDSFRLPMEAVEPVFTNLSRLVLAVVRAFPAIKDDYRWRALINASKVKI